MKTEREQSEKVQRPSSYMSPSWPSSGYYFRMQSDASVSVSNL